jgi:hypothetical protein
MIRNGFSASAISILLVSSILSVCAPGLRTTDHAVADEYDNAGTAFFPFLKVAQGTRAAALGGAYVALSDDASSLYWNPSCAMRVTDSEVHFDYFRYFADMQAGGLSYVPELGITGRMGFALYFLSYGSISKVDDQRNFEDTFSPIDIYSIIGYSMDIRDDLLVGSTVKFLFESIDEYSATGIGIDVGVFHRTRMRGVDFGLAVRNIGYQITAFEEEKYILPLTFAFGAAYRSPAYPLVFTLEVDRAIDYRWVFKGGGEWVFSDVFACRAGYSTRGSDWKTGSDGDGIAGFSAGFGVLIGQYGIDYAFVPHGGLGDVHRMSLRITY